MCDALLDWCASGAGRGHSASAVRSLEGAQVVVAEESAELSTVVHELSNPVTVIRGFSEILFENIDQLTKTQISDYLSRIVRQADRLALLVSDLSEVSKLGGGRLEVQLASVNVAEVFHLALEDNPPPPGQTVEVGPAEHVIVVGDPFRLEQILVNLLSNAYRYGGNEVRLEAALVGDAVELSVSDNGNGVPADIQDSLFTLFSKGSNAVVGTGSGLGLGIARGLARALGGDLRYEAGPPVSRFVLSLKRAEEGGMDLMAGALGAEDRGVEECTAAKILVVEDEPDMRFLLRLTLEGAGHQVTEARDGSVAWGQIQKSRPDLVVTDLMMPVMNGQELIKRLRADPETASIPVLVVSVRADMSTAVPSVERNMAKPFHAAQLLEAVSSMLEPRLI